MVIGRVGSKRKTLGADKGYNTEDFVDTIRGLNITPHFAKRENATGMDGRTFCHEGYEISQRRRKRVEEIFGWLKTIGNMRKVHYKGKEKVSAMFTFSVAIYNVLRIRNLCYA